MTVSELRKALRGISGKLEVYTRDHDQCEYEVNSRVQLVEVKNQKDMDEDDVRQMNSDHGDRWRGKGRYVVIGT